MSYCTTPKLPLKVMINKQESKVLFAEANSDFINVLLSFLGMPLGKIVKNSIPLGSLTALNSSLSNLDESYFSMPGAKQMLLNPESSFRAECSKLAIDLTDSVPNQYFVCQDRDCIKSGSRNVSMYSDIATCECGKSLNRSVSVGDRLDAGVFTISPLSFIITGDLRIAPIVSGIIQTLNSLGISDTQGAELTFLSFNAPEVRKLLSLCLTSTTPLNDMIFAKSGVISTAAKPEPGILLHHIQKSGANPRKMVLKVCLQKSTNKFLFAEAMDEFVEFLITFLTLPLAGVEFLLGGNTGLKNIDNLYSSVTNGIDAKYFTTPDMKNRLINPKLPHGYKSEYPFLPLSEDNPPRLYYKEVLKTGYIRSGTLQKYDRTYFHHGEYHSKQVSSFKSSKKTYVKEQTMCFVMDDLTVSPSLATNISFLNGLGVPLSDVKEMELHIGLEEALRILKVSLTSKTALTDALITPMLKLQLQPKQER